jgi:hypothetical protein
MLIFQPCQQEHRQQVAAAKKKFETNPLTLKAYGTEKRLDPISLETLVCANPFLFIEYDQKRLRYKQK